MKLTARSRNGRVDHKLTIQDEHSLSEYLIAFVSPLGRSD